MKHVDMRVRSRTRKTHQRPAGVRRRMAPLSDPLDLRRHRVGLAPERNNFRRVFERQQRGHEPFDVAPDTGRGRGEGPTVDSDSQLISICRRRTGRLVRVQISRMRVSTLPLMARLLRITSSTPYCRIVASRLSIEPRTGTPTIQR